MSAAPDWLIYPVHAAFWGSFGVTRLILTRRDDESAEPAPAVTTEVTARFARLLVAFHAIGFTVMYFGIGQAVFGHHLPDRPLGQQIAGTLVIALGAALMSSALVAFKSWRLQARLEVGHQLATGGPFRLVRHPIYMGLNLLALGSAIWLPTVTLWIGVVLMALGSDLRACAEERVLRQAFGPVYDAYCARTRRFLPGVY